MRSFNQNPPAGVAPLAEINLAALISRIRASDQTAKEEFTRLFYKGIRLLLSRKLQSADVEQGVQNTLSIAVRAIETGQVVEPEHLLSLVLATIKQQRSTLSHYDTQVRRRLGIDEGQLDEQEGATQLEEVIRKMSKTERDVLKRYYVSGEDPESIRTSLNLPLAEVRLMIVDIKTRFRSLKRAAGES